MKHEVDRADDALVVATHNLMSGLRLGHLLPHYRTLRDASGLDVLCLQENRCLVRGGHGLEIARALGPRYRHLADPQEPDVGLVYDGDRLRCREHVVFPLPQVRPSFIERRLRGPRNALRHAQIAVFEDATGRPLTVANFHLNIMGGTRHRLEQVRELARRLRRHERPGGIVACGDTNAFHWLQTAQPTVLARVLAPLDSLGVRAVCDPRPTHYFARANEPRLPHQLAVALGRLGLDLPQRYDVVCTNLEVTATGSALTPDSDHDLVWAALAPQAAAQPRARASR